MQLIAYGAQDIYLINHENNINNYYFNNNQFIKEKTIYEKQLEYILSINLYDEIINDDIINDDIINDDVINDDITSYSFALFPQEHKPSGICNYSKAN